MLLTDPLTVLPGVGPKKAERFAALGVRTLLDLMTFFPRTYEDRTVRRTIDALTPGEPACFEAMVTGAPRTAFLRKGLEITHLTVADKTGTLKLTFFNQRFSAAQLHYGERYLFYGTVEGGLLSSGEMKSPSFEPLSRTGETTNCILPVYPLTEGLSAAMVRRAVDAALPACLPQLEEFLPEEALTGLPDIRTSYHDIHRPASQEALAAARKRLVFEEFFVFSCGLSLLRARRTALRRPPMPEADPTDFYAALPFQPTNAQRRAIAEICADFQSGVPMNRLLQGDVGSGKTLVAAAAMACAARCGCQSALMAPTEILAEQHYATLAPLFASLGVSCCLLTGSTPAAEKRACKARLAAGDVQAVLGTHALISKDVAYRNRGLVVTDEQHRFGVAQRTALSEKGDHPHLLVMSATPIPRTLALILYGDLDVSVLDEKPAGRQTIDTFLVGESMRQRIQAFIRRQVQEGHQVYIVCPAIEESEDESLKSAVLWAETLQRTVFPDLRVGLLHGQMKGADKDAVMTAFSEGRLDILVSTTVVEVGVDVPNATLMVIENADRFGLSQLHQLRGRVGRGRDKSYCVLFTGQKNPETLERLRQFCRTNDGFRIAEADLALRGPGDFFGARQHGMPLFRVADLAADLSVLTDARAAADRYLTGDPDLRRAPALRARISALFAGNFDTFN